MLKTSKMPRRRSLWGLSNLVIVLDVACLVISHSWPLQFAPLAEKVDGLLRFLHRTAIVLDDIPFRAADAFTRFEDRRPIQIIVGVPHQSASLLFGGRFHVNCRGPARIAI